MVTGKEVVEISGLKIWDTTGDSRVELNGSYSIENLAQKLIEEWIPYFDCDHCGRRDYCKYVKPHPYTPTRSSDIRCGVAVQAITELVRRTFNIFASISELERQEWLDGAFYFAKYVYESELQIGNFLNPDILDYYGSRYLGVFGIITELRRRLDSMAKHMGTFSELNAKGSVLLLEGETEEVFIKKLSQSGLAEFHGIKIETYRGKANRKLKKIQMLLENYIRRGIRIYLQGDGDGDEKDTFVQIKKKYKIPEEQIFTFRNDFETAIPPKLFISAIKEVGKLKDVNLEDYRQNWSRRPKNQNATQFLKERYNLSLEPLKKKIAEIVADNINSTGFNGDNPWWEDDTFKNSEICQFIYFVIKTN